jgi:hypothetical protein
MAVGNPASGPNASGLSDRRQPTPPESALTDGSHAHSSLNQSVPPSRARPVGCLAVMSRPGGVREAVGLHEPLRNVAQPALLSWESGEHGERRVGVEVELIHQDGPGARSISLRRRGQQPAQLNLRQAPDAGGTPQAGGWPVIGRGGAGLRAVCGC